MDIFKIVTAALCVAVLHFSFRRLLCRRAEKDLLAMGARWQGREIILAGDEETLEYAIRCALLIADGKLAVTVYISACAEHRSEMVDIVGRFCVRHRNLAYQIL